MALSDINVRGFDGAVKHLLPSNWQQPGPNHFRTSQTEKTCQLA